MCARINRMDWYLVGHEWASDLLRGQLARGEQRHAYLITGPRSAGKRTLAIRFAQALNCTNPPEPGSPCQQCRTCLQTEKFQLPDLSVIEGSDDASIKVEQIRELGRTLALTPYASKTRVALLLNFDSATVSAQNALLKTLEEAPPKVVLVITALSSDSLLPTIVSRCEIIRLRRTPAELIAGKLASDWQVAPEKAELLAHLSGGRMGMALKLNDSQSLQDERISWIEDLHTLLQGNRQERFAYAFEACSRQHRDRLKPLLQTWTLYWRDTFLIASKARVVPINADWKAEINELARALSVEQIERAFLATENALNTLENTNVNPQLLTEVLLLDWPTLN